MIQDLSVRFDNQFAHQKPLEKSRIIFSFGKNYVALKAGSQETHNEMNESQTGWNDHPIPLVEMAFPSYQKVKELVTEPVFLFSIEEEGFYWQKLMETEKPFADGDQSSDTRGKSIVLDLIQEAYPDKEIALLDARAFRAASPKEMAMAGMVADQMIRWYEKNHYCGACGHELLPDQRERMLRCKCCGNMIYPRINPAVIVAVTDEDRLLLTRYRGRGYKNYALVAGFVEMGESLEQCVAREVMEEVGLEVCDIQYYKSQPWGFADNILTGFFCKVRGKSQISMDKEELSVAEWVRRDEIKEINQDMSLTNEMICAFAQGLTMDGN